MLQSHWSQNILLGVLALVIIALGYWGWGNAVRASQSKRVVKDVRAITEGLDYFHKDQNRYPTTGEFQDANIMRSYISNFPPRTFQSKTCSATFDYYNPASQTYELRFCISKAAYGYEAGVNVIEP